MVERYQFPTPPQAEVGVLGRIGRTVDGVGGPTDVLRPAHPDADRFDASGVGGIVSGFARRLFEQTTDPDTRLGLVAGSTVDLALGGMSRLLDTPAGHRIAQRGMIIGMVAYAAVHMGLKTDGPDSVGQYLNEIGLVPLLTADKERELSQIIEKGVVAQEKIDDGDNSVANRRAVRARAQAKDRFIRANLRLVVSVARRYPLPPSMELLDLIQEGNLGLEHAVDKFDWRKGFKFSTYATFWIRQAISRALDQKASLVRLPGDRSASLRAALRDVSGDGDKLDGEQARLHRLTTPTSLDRTIGDDDSAELVDLLPDATPGPEFEVMARAEETMVADLLEVLDPRAKYAIEQRFGLNDGRKHSYREVGEELGVTAEAARRLVKRAISAVREQAGDVMHDFDGA